MNNIIQILDSMQKMLNNLNERVTKAEGYSTMEQTDFQNQMMQVEGLIKKLKGE